MELNMQITLTPQRSYPSFIDMIRLKYNNLRYYIHDKKSSEEKKLMLLSRQI